MNINGRMPTGQGKVMMHEFNVVAWGHDGGKDNGIMPGPPLSKRKC